MMKSNFAALAILVLGCAVTAKAADNVPARLIGTWVATIEIDEPKLKQMLQDSGTPLEALPQIMPIVKQQMSNLKVTMVIRPDGTSSGTVAGIPGQPPKEEKSKWAVVEETPKTIKIKTTEADGETSIVTLEFLTDDKFKLSVPELEEAPVKTPVFTRQKTVPN